MRWVNWHRKLVSRVILYATTGPFRCKKLLKVALLETWAMLSFSWYLWLPQSTELESRVWSLQKWSTYSWFCVCYLTSCLSSLLYLLTGQHLLENFMALVLQILFSDLVLFNTRIFCSFKEQKIDTKIEVIFYYFHGEQGLSNLRSESALLIR